jgi:homoserine dehydrogenase
MLHRTGGFVVERVGVGLLGYGTVGSGVGTLLRECADDISLATGKQVYLAKVLELPGFSHPHLDPGLVVHDVGEILADPEIRIVVELIGGVDAALEFERAALQAGKHVVTANKQLIAQHGAELFDVAEQSGAHLRFEASCAGAIPVIKALRESLAAAQVDTIFGIVNGTTNYVMSAMSDTGAPYDEVLKKAQELGFAEADPTEDVSGKDAAAKMAILSSIGFHSRTTLADVPYEGITGITAADIAHATSYGYVIKLLGVAKLIDGRANVRVYPAFVPMDHPLASVGGAYNAVFLESRHFDKIMLYGPGAGSIPTASAVIGDIIGVITTAPGGFVRNCTCYRDLAFFPHADMVSSFYVRLQVTDKPGVLGQITPILGEEGVSVRSMWQSGRDDTAELVLLLHPAREAAVTASLERIAALECVQGEPTTIRVEGEEPR